jgi:tetratricopeptide (TPR) repeat protein
VSYAFSGILEGYQPAARLMVNLNDEDYSRKDFLLRKVIAFYLLGNTAKATELLDDILTQGKHYPMRITKPTTGLEVSDSFYPFFKEMENDDQFTNLARYRCNQHLLKSIEFFRAQNYKTAALHFDRLYLCDHLIFLETIQNVSAEYAATMFLLASRIHSNHTQAVIDYALQNHKPDLALSAARYGIRFNHQDLDFQFAKARALFHKQDYFEAQNTCLMILSLHPEEDRSRWLLEQILVRIKENSLVLGGFDTSPTEK